MLAAYRLLTSVAYRLPLPPGVLRASRAGRRGAAARWRAWGGTARGAGPIVWAHGASIGEVQVLEPILERLVRARPDLRVVLSHTSPSVPATRIPACVCQRDYLPWDRPLDAAMAIAAVRPSLVLIARSDLWPAFVAALAAREVPIAVAGATVRAGSRRLGATARAVLRPTHERIAWLGAATADDADRWRRLGVPPERVVVTGDPRHDRILERPADLAPAVAVRSWAGGGPVLILGSLEPPDDGVVAGALARLRLTNPDLRTVIVPHDPAARRLDGLEQRLGAHGLRTTRWGGPSAGPLPPRDPVAVVTARGILADLYVGADVAYVGGGFTSRRLHAVAEPAAVGLPVIVGPRWRGATDADRMVASGGAIPVDTARRLADAVARLASDPAERSRRGLTARQGLAEGAARASAGAALALLDRVDGPRPAHPAGTT